MDDSHYSKQENLGRNIRLALSCIEGKPSPVKGPALPANEAAIRTRLKALSQDITSHQADLLDLLVRFDDLQGWAASGASHCASWMNEEIGISIKLGWEYLRVGRKLNELPTLKALFRAGKISWSKVRLITRVANADNESLLCHAALDASVSDVKRFCDGYKWNDDANDTEANHRALQQWESRSLTWNETSNGSTRIQITLPPEIAQAFLNSVEHSLNQFESQFENRFANQAENQPEHTFKTHMAQRRADAAVRMAEASLQAAGKDMAIADRYQVIVSVDKAELTKPTPHGKRATINGATGHAAALSKDKVRRLACDCSISTISKINGEPVDIGRKSRIWPAAMARAIKERDQHCVWPGCTQSRHLHIHHIKHWADGGSTSVDNAACLCVHHHTLVHEGGFTLQNTDNDHQQQHAQFKQQQLKDDLSLFEFEQALRNNKRSFAQVRKLLPTRYRFNIISATKPGGKTKNESYNTDSISIDSTHIDSTHIDSTRIDSTPIDSRQLNASPTYCAEQSPDQSPDQSPEQSPEQSTQCRESSAAYQATSPTLSVCALTVASTLWFFNKVVATAFGNASKQCTAFTVYRYTEPRCWALIRFV